MRTPKEVHIDDGTVCCVPPEYDDMGGGAPGIQIEAFIYDSKGIDKLIKILNEKRYWLNRINKG